MLLSAKTRTTGGEKGVPVELRLRVPREKKVSQCCFKQKNRPTGGEKGAPVELRLRVPKKGKKVSQCCFGPKQNHRRRKRCPSGVKA